MKAVLDTNVLVSALLLPNSVPGQIYEAWSAGEFDLVLSQYIIDEFLIVAKLKFPQSLDIAREIALELTDIAEVVVPATVSPATVLLNDWPIVGTALAGRAEFLVTGDKLLLNLKRYHNANIISPADFLDLLLHDRL